MEFIVKQRLIFEFFRDFFYAPLWWYTKGTRGLFEFFREFLLEMNTTLAPKLWIKNIFVPMFGQTDWQGRIMSVFMRIVNIFFRSIALIFIIFFLGIIGLVWFIAPLIFFGMFFYALLTIQI